MRNTRRRPRERRRAARYSDVPASWTGQLDDWLKQAPDITSQQLTPPFCTGGQVFWQS
jgi:hypothetical protein